MRYTERVEDADRTQSFAVLAKMEVEYRRKNAEFFNNVLKTDPTLVVRVHAVTVLAEIGDETSVPVLADALKNDPSSLIRHECAFSLGQISHNSAVRHLIDAVLNDSSEIVRHESAAALGSIGDESAREALMKACNDESEEVMGSARASLFNLDFLNQSRETNNEILNEPLSPQSKEKQTKRMPHP